MKEAYDRHREKVAGAAGGATKAKGSSDDSKGKRKGKGKRGPMDAFVAKGSNGGGSGSGAKSVKKRRT